MAKNKIAPVIPSNDEVITALWHTGGLIKYAAAELKCDIDVLKNVIKKSKQLRNILFTIRETCLDEVEQTLYNRITGFNKETGQGDMTKIKDSSGILTMFYLKCLGKHRGWVDKPDKAGESEKKPIFIRILPVGTGNEIEEKKQRGRPKKIYAEAKVLPTSSLTKEEEELEDVIEGEVLD